MAITRSTWNGNPKSGRGSTGAGSRGVGSFRAGSAADPKDPIGPGGIPDQVLDPLVGQADLASWAVPPAGFQGGSFDLPGAVSPASSPPVTVGPGGLISLQDQQKAHAAQRAIMNRRPWRGGPGTPLLTRQKQSAYDFLSTVQRGKGISAEDARGQDWTAVNNLLKGEFSNLANIQPLIREIFSSFVRPGRSDADIAKDFQALGYGFARSGPAPRYTAPPPITPPPPEDITTPLQDMVSVTPPPPPPPIVAPPPAPVIPPPMPVVPPPPVPEDITTPLQDMVSVTPPPPPPPIVTPSPFGRAYPEDPDSDGFTRIPTREEIIANDPRLADPRNSAVVDRIIRDAELKRQLEQEPGGNAIIRLPPPPPPGRAPPPPEDITTPLQDMVSVSPLEERARRERGEREETPTGKVEEIIRMIKGGQSTPPPPPPPSVTPLPPGIRAKAVDSGDLLDTLRRAATSRAADEASQRTGLPFNPLAVYQGVRDTPAALRNIQAQLNRFFKPPDQRDAAQVLSSELMKLDPTGRLEGLPSQKPEDLSSAIRRDPPKQNNEMELFSIELMRELMETNGEEFVRDFIDQLGGTSMLPVSKEKLLQGIGLKPLTIYEEIFGLEEMPFTPSNRGLREPANRDTFPEDIMKLHPTGTEGELEREIQQPSPGRNLEDVDFLQPHMLKLLNSRFVSAPPTLESGAMQEMIRRMFGGSVDQESKRKMNVRRQQYRTS